MVEQEEQNSSKSALCWADGIRERLEITFGCVHAHKWVQFFLCGPNMR